MAYYTNLFSPETYEAFTQSDQSISGFKPRLKNAASKIRPGDKLVCYVTKISCWVGILEVTSEYFESDTPIFYSEDDPFVIRFRVKPLVWLPKENAVPIHDNHIWETLSFTQNYDKNSTHWTGKIRNSLNLLSNEDGRFLEELLERQEIDRQTYELDESGHRKLVRQRIQQEGKVVSSPVPQGDQLEEDARDKQTIRESYQIQALLARIGEAMRFTIWLPRSDRSNITQEWMPSDGVLIDTLPLSYNEATLKTIEQIDVLWLQNRSIIRAFEVEHSTAIYSGILRMADLLALQPNMDIRLHIVAPCSRKEKVLQEIQRPIFSLFKRAPLSKICSFISYDNVRELSAERHLSHLSDEVLEEYAERA